MTLILFFIVFTGLVFTIMNLLPTATLLPTQIHDSLTLVVGYIKAWNGIFAFTPLLEAVSFVAVMYGVIWTVKAFVWTLKLVRGGTS